MGTYVFENVSTAAIGGSCILYVPEGSEEAYSQAPHWRLFAPNIKSIPTTNIEKAEKDYFQVVGGKGEITIYSTNLDEIVEIYNSIGQQLSVVYLNEREQHISVPQGILIVKRGKESFRIFVE